MPRGRAIAACRLSVAVIVSLANGGGPGLWHAHAGGERPHRHHTPTAKHCEHEYKHHGHSHAHPHPSELLGADSHVHLWLFGFEFASLPLPYDSREDSDGEWRQFVASPFSVGPSVRQLSGTEYNLFVVAIVNDRLLETRPISLHLADRFASLPAIAAPLCDTARHERSGVQLI